MTIDKLRERLDSLAHEPDASAAKRRDEWVQDLDVLVSSIETWLKPLENEGRVRVTKSRRTFSEQAVGPYEAPLLFLEFLGVPEGIDVAPVGLQIVGVRLADGRIRTGVQGRVNMSYGALKLPIVRFRDRTWSVSTYTQPDLRPLDDTTFSEALVDLLPRSED